MNLHWTPESNLSMPFRVANIHLVQAGWQVAVGSRRAGQLDPS